MVIGKRSIKFQIRRYSWICGFLLISTFLIKNRGLNFYYQILIKYAIYIKPRRDFGIAPKPTTPMARNIENLRFFWDGCWKRKHSSINSIVVVDLRSLLISASATKIWGSIFYYLIGLISVIYIRPRVDLGVPPYINGSDAQKHGKSKIFSKMAVGKISIPRQIQLFSWICGSRPISAFSNRELGLIFCYQILII